MATNTNLHLVRTSSELPGSEASHLASISFGGGWARARQTYSCSGTGPAHEIPQGTQYFAARLASGTVRFCRPCADAPHQPTVQPDPFDFGGAA